MLLATLSPRLGGVLSDEAAASAARIDRDVRLALSGVAARRAELLTRGAGARYRAALLETTTAAWRRFAAALGAVLRAADSVSAAIAAPDAADARRRLRAFLTENPDLGRDRSSAGATP
jgi:hypothetical protein